MKKWTTKKNFNLAITILFMGMVGFLTYHQIHETNASYPSDYVVHIELAFSGKSYTLFGVIANITKLVFGKFYDIAIAITMSVILLFSIYAIYLCVKKLSNHSNAWLLAIIISAIGIAYIPGKGIYLGFFVVNLYHSPTYLLMKPFAFLSFYFYIKCREQMKNSTIKNIDWKDWLWFSGCLCMSAWSKPTFFTIFAPVMLIDLIVDFVISKTKNVKKEFIFGLSVFPTVAVCLIQSVILFDDQASVEINFGWNFQTFDYTVLKFVQSLLFPLLVLVIYVWKRKIQWWYVFGWGCFAIGFLQVMFFMEKGRREMHGNFLWSGHAGAFMLMFVSVVGYFEYLKDKNKSIGIEKSDWIAWIPMIALLWQVASGVYYLGKLCTGVWYFFS